MKKYKVEIYNSTFNSDWNKFVENSINGTFLFHRDYMEYHNDRFVDFSLMIFDEKAKLVSLLPGNKNHDTFYSHQGLTYGGFVVQEKIGFEDYTSIVHSALKFLLENGFKKLFVKPIPSYYSDDLIGEFDYILFLLQAKLVRRDIISIYDLKKNNSISRIRKRGIQKGIQNELKIIQDDRFNIFWNEILIPNLQNKYNTSPVHTLDEILLLKSKFPNQIKQYNVYWNNQIVAGITIYEMKNVIHPQYVSGNPELNNQLGSIDFMYHELINLFYKDKKYLDFGPSNEENGMKINSTLHYFKQSFGCESTTQSFYEIELENYLLLENIYL